MDDVVRSSEDLAGFRRDPQLVEHEEEILVDHVITLTRALALAGQAAPDAAYPIGRIEPVRPHQRVLEFVRHIPAGKRLSHVTGPLHDVRVTERRIPGVQSVRLQVGCMLEWHLMHSMGVKTNARVVHS